MKPMKTRDAALTLFGLLCLAAYILACRPAFSPDGSRILFSTWDKETQRSSVVLFDRRTQRPETILVSKGLFPSAQWTADGKEAILAWAEEGKTDQTLVQVMILPLGRGNPTQILVFALPAEKDLGTTLAYFPPPVEGGNLFLGGETLVYRLNLETGEIKKEDYGQVWKGFLLTGQSNQVYYLAGLKGDAGDFEIGRIDRDSLAKAPILRIEKKDVGEISPFLSISRDGSRIAIVSKKPPEPQQGNLERVLIFRGSRLETTIPVGSERDPIALGNTEWSSDGATTYAAFFKRREAERDCLVGVLELPVSGAGLREIPLLHLNSQGACSRTADTLETVLDPAFQIALSPDGKTIAATSANLDSVKEEDRALYLVDLATPDRKVTKIPISPPQTPKPTQKKE